MKTWLDIPDLPESEPSRYDMAFCELARRGKPFTPQDVLDLAKEYQIEDEQRDWMGTT